MEEVLKSFLKRVCHTEHTLLLHLKGKDERELRNLIWDAHDLLIRDRCNRASKPRQERRRDNES
jgi:hypothetical protein